ncbi:MAG: sugar phosphate nucleotidyltransferase [Candidatus Eremiobacteraeota bacterium]|nr:sugar phosphate nucleotidyltransferase [Candidatus Eremiobacteraeota bacterium]
MKAVVMAGGEGTRLRPLTINRPKPLVPVCNKPIMEHIIDLLKLHGITEIIVTLHYLAEEIVSYFGDGREFGVSMVYSVEDEPLGTAGSVRKVRQYLDETFLILSGDALTDFDLSEIIQFHREKESQATITLTRVANPLEFGVVITDEEHRIKRFLEKPSWGEVFSDTINTGIYCLEPAMLDSMEPGKVYDFSKDIFPVLLDEGKPLYGFISKGYWCDIGNLQQYRQAIYDTFSKNVKAIIPGKQVRKNLWVGDNSELHSSVHGDGPVVIGKNCKIKENVLIDEFTAIGDNCIIEEGASLQRSIVWSNAYIGKNSRVNGTILCRGVTLKEKALTLEGAIVGDKCFIGKGTQISSNVKIWPEKKIEAGSTVSMSLIWGGRWQGSLFGEDGITGIANIEITPEFAMKLGAAFGAYLEKGAIVSTSRDAHPAARLINRSVICGLTSVGINIWDHRVMPTPLSRHSTRNSVARGGVHTRINPSDPRSVLIEFYDKRGINIDKDAERKIENIFFREDFRRTSLEEVGDISFPARALDNYTEGFFHNLVGSVIRNAGFKVVIDYGYNTSSIIFPVILGKLGCDTVAINAYLDPSKELQTQANRRKSLTQLAKVVTTLGSDLGIFVDFDAECLFLIDEKGSIIPNNVLLSLMAALVFKSVKDAVIAVPVSAPSILDLIAHRSHGSVIRTKLDGRSLMHAAALGEKKIIFAGNEKGAFIYPRFHSAFDAMFAFAKLLEFLATHHATVSKAVEELPPFFQEEKSVECSFQEKGRIMRKLLEQNREQPIETIDGLKIHFSRSWVLLVPDPIEASIHIITEAPSRKEARELLAKFEGEVRCLLSEREASPEPEPPRDKTPLRKRKCNEPVHLVSPEKSFHFWIPGRYLGKKARSLRELRDAIDSLELESLEYHVRREDFVRWIEFELKNEMLAGKIRSVREMKGEELRRKIVELLQ